MPRRQTNTIYDIYHNGVFIGTINEKGVVVATHEPYPTDKAMHTLQLLVDQGDKQQRLEIYEHGKSRNKDRMYLPLPPV